jgi:zinc protease
MRIKLLHCIILTLICGLNIAAAKPILNINHWQTNNGATAYFVKATQLPILDVRVLFNAGSRQDNKLYGIANSTAMMLDEGTNQLNANQIAEIDVNRDMSILSLRCLTKKTSLIPSINLLHDLISNPIFPLNEFKRVKSQILTEIVAQLQQPTIIATLNFYKNLYGNSPYAHPVIGTQASVKSIKLSDVKKFYHKYYTAKNAIIILVGNISPQTAHILANKIAANLPTGKPIPPLPQTQPVTQNLVKHISYPGTQSYIRLGCVGINFDNKNYFPILIGNHILGGGILVSRLFNEVRQKNGLSYSVKSKFILLKNRGPFIISLQTKNKLRNKALKITQKVLNDFVKKGPTQQELQDAKKFLLGSFALQRASNAKIANLLSMMAFYKLPLDYLDTYKQNVNAVTAEQIKQTFQEIIGKQKLVIVSVGNS